jgi:4-hydroxybenzoate polyprenyl transferase
MIKIKNYLDLIRFFNPSGWILLYPNCVLGLLIGAYFGGSIKPLFFLQFMLGAFFARSAGCVINDILDRDFDAKVERTKNRPLATGSLTVKNAVLCLIVMLLCGLIVLFSLPLRVILICLASSLLIFTYPLFKRFTYFPQVFLGLNYSVGFLAGFFAVCDHFVWQILLICFALIVWTVIFDTIYAMQDVKDDLKIGVKSTAVFFGENCKRALYIFNAIYLLFLLAFWHFSGLKLVIFPVLSFVFISILIKKSRQETFFKMYKLNFLATIILCIGIVFNLL